MGLIFTSDVDRADAVTKRFQERSAALATGSGGLLNPRIMVTGGHSYLLGGILVGTGLTIHICHKSLGLTFGCRQSSSGRGSNELLRAEDKEEFTAGVSRLGKFLGMTVHLGSNVSKVLSTEAPMWALDGRTASDDSVHTVRDRKFAHVSAVLITEAAAVSKEREVDEIFDDVHRRFNSNRPEVMGLLNRLRELSEIGKRDFRAACQQEEAERNAKLAADSEHAKRDFETAQRLGFTHGTSRDGKYELWLEKRSDYFFSPEAAASVQQRIQEARKVEETFISIMRDLGGVAPSEVQVRIPAFDGSCHPDDDGISLFPAGTSRPMLDHSNARIIVAIDKAGWDHLKELGSTDAAAMRRMIRSLDFANSPVELPKAA